ncbi:unnamed protein product [Miscanthus lutarioriparius]|uniref:ATP-dependent RNA helicase Ski2/MTR4 C-terminal domain-containing protein n=1 Tax=Miscanthus lutarioriparius TaxID=422564 RepID=A0A811PJ44_9POAL|nr:unnamed protein product [Miscanthus lutarioriparius]
MTCFQLFGLFLVEEGVMQLLSTLRIADCCMTVRLVKLNWNLEEVPAFSRSLSNGLEYAVQGSKVTHNQKESDDVKVKREELSEEDYAEISLLQKRLKEEKQIRNELKKKMELERMAAWKNRLEEFENKDSIQHTIPAVFIGNLNSFTDQKITNMVEDDSFVSGKQKLYSGEQLYCPSYYVALSSDNSWYLFTEKWIKTVYKTGLPAVASVEGGTLPRETLKQLLLREELMWDKVAKSEYGSLLSTDGSLDTWSWSLNVPVLNSLSEDDEVERFSQEHQDAVECYKQQSYVYEPSSVVTGVISYLEEQRNSLIDLQERHGVKIPCEIDAQFAGMVEAWTSGLTWREIMMDSAMDDGDLARLLRRSIDLLAQIPKLPDIDPVLQKNAQIACSVMDRVPISELAG